MKTMILTILLLVSMTIQVLAQQGHAILKLTVDDHGNVSVLPVTTEQEVKSGSASISAGQPANIDRPVHQGSFVLPSEAEQSDIGLTVPNLTFDLNQSTFEYDPGTKIITMNTRVVNTGTSATISNVELTYYLSSDQNIVPLSDDCAIGNDQVPPLAPGAFQDERFSRVLCNVSCSASGTWYVGLFLDPLNQLAESNENDNAAVSTSTINLLCSDSAPNLTFDLNNTTWNFNTTTCVLSLNTRVVNTGDVDSERAWLGYYLSDNENIVTSDSRIGRERIPQLSSGEEFDHSFSADLSSVTGSPPFVLGNTYYIGWIVDYMDEILEADENDNRVVSNGTIDTGECGSGGLPNLVIDSNNSSATFNANTCLLNINARVVNSGSAQAAASTLGYYLSSDNQITASDSRIGDDPVSSLAAGAGSTEGIAVDLNTTSGSPPITPGNSYFVGLICDYLNQVNESSESDNDAALGPQFTVSCGSQSGGCAVDAVDIALVIDRSGSMSSDDKLGSAKIAANTFIGFTQVGDNLAVVSYAGNTSVDFPLTQIVGEQTRNAARNAVNSLFANGSTSIGGGMQVGQNELNKGQPDNPNAMLLLSDGRENTSPLVNEVLPTIPAETDIYTIGLGFDVNPNLMSSIATATGGTYSFVPTAAELQEIYLRIQGQITGQQIFTTASGQISQGQVLTHNVRIDALSPCVSFILTFPSGDLDFELVTPNGQVINPQVAGGDADIGYFETQTSASYSVSQPQPGLWTLRINGVSLSSSVGYFTLVQGVSDLTLQATLDKNQYNAGEPILVCATLQEAGSPVTGATVRADVTLPGSSVAAYREANRSELDKPESSGAVSRPAIESVTQVITLFDDGSHGDGAANDGVYCNSFTDTFNDGSYEFNVIATGVAPQAGQFSRESNVSAVVNPGQTTSAIRPLSPASVTGTANNQFEVFVEVSDVNNFFGVSFDLRFDPTHIDAVDVSPESFIGSDPVFLDVVDNAAGEVGVGISRKSGESGVSGSGNIVRVAFEVSQNLTQNEQVDFTIANVQANDPNGAAIVLQPLSSTTTLTSGLIVWPGDTDNDGVVDQADVLPIGLHFGRTGPSRANASLTWTGQAATPWNPQQATYVDADGNGETNQADVLPIGLNFSKTHTAPAPVQLSAKTAASGQELLSQNGTLGLAIVGDANPGEDFTIEVFASDVSNLFGVSFEMVFSPTNYVTVNDAEVGDNNLLGSDVIFLPNIDNTTGTLSLGITRKAGQGGVSGSGMVARVLATMSASAVVGEDTTHFALQNVTANDPEGNPITLDVTETTLVTSIDDLTAELPGKFALHQNYPNPFNPETVIHYDLPGAAAVVIEVFDLLGRKVRTLVDGTQSAGNHKVVWDGRDDRGRRAASGVYVYNMRAGEFTQNRKLILLR